MGQPVRGQGRRRVDREPDVGFHLEEREAEMNIVIYKDGQYGHNVAELFEKAEEMAAWAEKNRDKTFRAFQAQEMEVVKTIQFKMKPVSR